MNVRFLGLTAAALLGSAALAQHTISYSRIVDLSHVITPDIPLWPGDPPVEMETVASFDTDGYHLRRFSIGEHSATHMNAPNSFHEGGVGIDAYPPESLVVPAKPITGRPELADSSHIVSPTRLRPAGLLKVASATCASGRVIPLLKEPVITPRESTVRPESWPEE